MTETVSVRNEFRTPDDSVTVIDGSAGLPFGSNSMQHGTAVFDGIRCYRTERGPALFRLDEHLNRLLASASTLGIRHRYSRAELRNRVLAAVAGSGVADGYVRPVLFTEEARLGVDLGQFEFRLGIEIWPLPAVGRRSPITVTVSEWRRPSPLSFPPAVKATGMYATSALARTEAARRGFDEAIQLDPHSGRVAEATIANVFVVRGGQLWTPWPAESLLAGITRDCLLVLARLLGIEAIERPVEESDVLTADELFLTGTASELVPVGRVDDVALPAARPIFDLLRDSYAACTAGRRHPDLGWLTLVPPADDSVGLMDWRPR